MKKLLALTILTASIILANPALAEKGGNGHGHGHKHKHGKHYERDSNGNVIVISGPNRTIIKQYIVEDYHSHCPPGLAKKHNGCLPPGQAKKRYIIGRPLPQTVIWEPVPQPLLVQLQPAPVGYQYVKVDKDVLLISEASHNVIDAITLLSAVGR